MKIGFIGGWGHHYLRGLLADGQSPLPIQAAVAGDGYDNPAARRWAQAQHISLWFDDPQQMVDEFKPDAVSIGAVYGYNSNLIALALAQNLPVVSDKPVAATWDQLQRLMVQAMRKPQILLTEFDFRSRREFRSAQEAIAQGLIGDIVLASAQKSYRFGTRPPWYADRNSYSGTLLWIASHGIDAIQWVTGRKITRVIGRQGNLSRPDFGSMEDHVALLAELDNGGSGLVHADFLRPAAAPSHGDDRLRIAGTKGVIEVRGERCILINSEQGETDITDRAVVRPIHLELLSALQGQVSPWYSTTISLATARLLLHARDAADKQCWVDIKDYAP